jgi:hypothetical protein
MKYSKSMKYLRLHEISAPRQRCSRLIIYDSNKATLEMLAAYKRCWRPEMLAAENVGVRKCWRPKMLASENVGVRTLTIWARQNLQSSDSFSVRLKSSPLRRCCLSSMKFSVPLKSSLPDGVVSPPCRPQVGSALRHAQLIWAACLPYCTGLLYRHDLSKCSRPSNVRGRRYFTFFLGIFADL